MKTTFAMLLEKTTESLGVLPIKVLKSFSEDTRRFETLRLGSKPEETCLFLTNYSMLRKLPVRRWPRQFFCIMTAGASPSVEGFTGNAAFFPFGISKHNLENAVSCAGDFFSGWNRCLLDMIYANASNDRLTEYAHDYFQNPILIYDSSLKVLAYTRNEDVGEKFWSETVENRAVTGLDEAEAVELRRYVELADKNAGPFRHTAPALARPFYSCNVMLNGKRVGMVDLMEKNHTVTQCELDVLENFCYLLSFEFQKDAVVRENIGSIYNHLLSDLIEDNIRNRDTLKARLTAVHWDIASYLRVLAFIPRNSFMSETEFESIFNRIIRKGLNGRGILYHGKIIFIVSSEDHRVLMNTDVLDLKQFCEAYKLRCGASDIGTDILETHTLAVQAERALELSAGTVTLFEKIRMSNLLNYCEKYNPKTDILHPAVTQLQALDRNGQSEYIKTLEAYFHCCCNQLQAAECLRIHRTTLFYRLQKIAEITGMDFNDPDEMLHVQFSLAVARYAHIL